MDRIETVQKQIDQLIQEKRALERSLAAARSGSGELRDVTRRNSIDRLLVESKIISYLSEQNKPTPVREIYFEARKVKLDLKENTLRVYLTRLKERGEIRSATRGRWACLERREDAEE